MRTRRPKPPGPPKPPPSRATLLKSIRDLSRLLPDEQQRINHIIQLSIHPDHTTAIASVACLEDALKTAIRLHLRPNLSPDDDKRLFEYSWNGMLSTLDSRIKMSYALGMLESDERDDLDAIRSIRNAFAHSGSIIDFSTGDIPKLVSSLHVLNRSFVPDHVQSSDTKAKFIFAISMYYVRLLTWRPSAQDRNQHWVANKATEQPSS
jgi:hypothetical protein